MLFNLSDEAKMFAQNVLTTAEVAEALGVSRQSIASYVRDNRLKVLKNTPSGFLFLEKDVLDFLHQKCINCCASCARIGKE